MKTLTIIEGDMKHIKIHKAAAMFLINGGKVNPRTCVIEIERIMLNEFGNPLFEKGKLVLDKFGKPLFKSGKMKTEIIKDYIVGFKIGIKK